MSGNANSGRRPKPPTLRFYEGARGAKPDDAAAEVRFRPGIPECPAWLPPLAREYWQHIAEEFGGIPGLIQQSDRSYLEQFCMAYYRWRTFEAFVQAHGATYGVQVPLPDGSTRLVSKIRPEAVLAKEASQELLRLRGELGVSRADRSRGGARVARRSDHDGRGLGLLDTAIQPTP